MSVIPLLPTVALLVAGALTLRLPGRGSRAVAVLAAVVVLTALLWTRADWEADVRRAVFIASQSKGRWLDRSVDLLLASGALTLAAALRSSRAGHALALALSAGALLCGWAAR